MSRAQLRLSSVRPMFAASLYVSISGVIWSSIRIASISLYTNPPNPSPPGPTNSASQTHKRLFPASDALPRSPSQPLTHCLALSRLLPTLLSRYVCRAPDSPAASPTPVRHKPSPQLHSNQNSHDATATQTTKRRERAPPSGCRRPSL